MLPPKPEISPPPKNVDPEVYRLSGDFMWAAHQAKISYLNLHSATEVAVKSILRQQQAHISRLAITEPSNATIEYLDQMSVTHTLEGEPGSPDERVAVITYAEYKERLSPGGIDQAYLGGTFLTLIYGLWEDNYRSKIAAAKGFFNEKGRPDKNKISHDLFGDLAELRHAATHNHCVATSEVETAKILRFFKRGDPLCVHPHMAEEIFRNLDEVIRMICEIPDSVMKAATGESPSPDSGV